MTTCFTQSTQHYLSIDGVIDDAEVPYSGEAFITPQAKDLGNGKVAIAYAVHDEQCESPFDSCDGNGELIDFRYTRDSEVRMAREHLGLNENDNPDLGLADVYGYLTNPPEHVKEVVKKLDDIIEQLKQEHYIEDAPYAAIDLEQLEEELTDPDWGQEFLEEYNRDQDEMFDILCDEVGSVLDELHDEFDTLWHKLIGLIAADLKTMWQKGRDNGTIGTKYTQVLDVYSHSGEAWSLSGGGMQCRWDTSRGAGLWVPDQCAIDNINSYLKANPDVDPDTYAASYAQSCIDDYNKWLMCDCYGVVAGIWNKETGKLIGDTDECWGYIGHEYVEQELKDRIEVLEKYHG